MSAQESKSRPASEPITLSTGTVIAHRREPNGSQFAYIEGREADAMTAAEWDEYCEVLRKVQS